MTRPKFSPPASARLFSDAEPAGPSAGVYLANIDGASRGNPGPASYAVVIRDPDGKIVLELAKRLGQTTNNVAEYYALLAALDYAVDNGITALRIRSDSELLVRQIQGRYKVKSPDLKPLFERASKSARQIAYLKIEHVRRELNRDADGLANVALDSGDVASVAVEKKAGAHVTTAAAGGTSVKSLEASSPLTAGAKSAVRYPPAIPKKSIRARFVRGVFVPEEEIELPEGAEVVLDLKNAEK